MVGGGERTTQETLRELSECLLNVAAVQWVCGRVRPVGVQAVHHPLRRPSRPCSCWDSLEGNHRQALVTCLLMVWPASVALSNSCVLSVCIPLSVCTVQVSTMSVYFAAIFTEVLVLASELADEEQCPFLHGVRWWMKKGWGQATGWGQCFDSFGAQTGWSSGHKNLCHLCPEVL